MDEKNIDMSLWNIDMSSQDFDTNERKRETINCPYYFDAVLPNFPRFADFCVIN